MKKEPSGWNFLDDFEETVEAHGFSWLVFWLIVIAVLLLAAAKSCHGQVPESAAQYQRLYIRIATATWGGLNPPIASLAAQIHQESGWNCTAVSPVGARGCAQFMPATAKWISSFSPGLASGLMNDPAWAFEAQVRYMAWLNRRIDADDECERFAFALSAYNGGEGRVRQRKALSGVPGKCFGVTCLINPGISPANQRENEQYPVRILKTIDTRYKAWGRELCGS